MTPWGIGVFFGLKVFLSWIWISMVWFLCFGFFGFFGSPFLPTVFGFRTSLLAHTFPLCHGVGTNVFGASLPCKARSLIHMPMSLCIRWLHTCLPDSTLYHFSFVVYAVMPLSFKKGDD